MIKKSGAGTGTAISIMNDRGGYVCSAFIGRNKIKNISRLYKILQHEMLMTCCYVEAANGNSVKE